MKYNNLIKNERSKPRLKLSHRIGYSLVKPKNLKNFTNVNGIDLMGLEHLIQFINLVFKLEPH